MYSDRDGMFRRIPGIFCGTILKFTKPARGSLSVSAPLHFAWDVWVSQAGIENDVRSHVRITTTAGSFYFVSVDRRSGLAEHAVIFRRIGTRTLIPVAELQRFARMDHPERIAC